MSRGRLRTGAVVLIVAAQATHASEPAPYDWSGSYAGLHAGGLLGFSSVSDPYGTSIFGDTIRAPGALIGAQAGHNWQSPGSSWVYGIEAEISVIGAEGTNTCFAYSGTFGSSNCRARPDFTGSLTGRVGYAFGDGRTLGYIKGGVAVLHNRIDATTNYGYGFFPITTVGVNSTAVGWTVGAGVERAISPAWSLKLEYDYMSFADATFLTATGYATTPAGFYTVIPPARAHVSQDLHAFKLGLNYKFGHDPAAAYAPAAPAVRPWDGWSIETGVRYWYSSGRFQKDLPNTATSTTTLISRLTFDGVSASSAEYFARIDSPWKVFVKGFIGAGRTSGGSLNDEDWGLVTLAPFTSYSNTVSNLADTTIKNGAIDVGYDFLRTADGRLGAFVGYTSVHEQYEADDCTQIASPSAGICTPPITGTAVITETDSWRGIRFGLAGDMWLTPRVKLSADAAYIPNLIFSGTDNHWLRALVISERGNGRGAQLEAMLSYYLTPAFSVGAGARYWTFWTTSGSDAFNGVPTARTDTYRYERYGLLLQAAYKFE